MTKQAIKWRVGFWSRGGWEFYVFSGPSNSHLRNNAYRNKQGHIIYFKSFEAAERRATQLNSQEELTL